jgi:hypothetical protein
MAGESLIRPRSTPADSPQSLQRTRPSGYGVGNDGWRGVTRTA